MRSKYIITTFGCQMNEHDSEKIAGMLEDLGYNETEEREDADIIILNTCSVRDNADQRFFGNLGYLKNLKKKNSELIVAVCGCMMQQEHIVEKIKKSYPFVDIVFGTHNLHELPQMLVKAQDTHKISVNVWDDGGEIIEHTPVKRKFQSKSLVNIMYGCNNFCSYCIVPYTRGRERSRNPKDIIAEVNELALNGTKEITLLGQNVNSYGKTLDNPYDFSDLLVDLNEIEGLERIRFMTSHPKDLSDKLIETMAKCSRVCDSIHLPIQSGSTRILKEMNRKYTREDYLEIINKIRKAIPHITISTDFIVGFPGETKEDFEETISLVKEVRYDNAFTFIYSPRKGTPAEHYEDLVDDKTKHEWFNELVKTLNNISYEKNKAYEGSIHKVLVEDVSKNNEERLSGRTESSKLVNFEGTPDLIGKIVTVKITEGKTFSLDGELLDGDYIK